VGSIIGFSVAAKGIGSINWDETKNIFISWFVSPVVTGVLGCVIFLLIKQFILMTRDPFNRGYYSFSLILFLTIALEVFFVVTKGTQNFDHFQNEVYDPKWVIPTSLVVGLVCALLWFWPLGPKAKRVLEERRMERENQTNEILRNVAPEASQKSGSNNSNDQVDVEGQTEEKIPSEVQTHAEVSVSQCDESSDGIVSVEPTKMTAKTLGSKLAKATIDQDLAEQAFEEAPRAKEIWQNMTHYDYEVEQLFTFVQVFTACILSFAHGANDVANAIAPVAAILAIHHGTYGPSADVPFWLLALGGLGIVLGLALYGYKVMKTIGFKLAAISPTRGSSANLAASIMVSTASFMGLPVSTTQCIVGAVAGVGAAEGLKSVQWLSLAVVVVLWVVAFFATATFSAGLYALGAYFHSLNTQHVH
jgi:sodium-dependent phosphate transporter